MKHNSPSTTLVTVFCALFVVGIAPALLADGDHVCSYRSVAGKWGFTYSGTVLPSSPVLGVGTFTLDKNGTLTDGRLTDGDGLSTFSGPFTVDPDCTGSTTLTVCGRDGCDGPFIFSIVWIDNSNATRWVLLESEIVTGLDGKKLFPNRD